MQRRIFELHACVGRGGFGEVYRATMRSPGGLVREVAVKMLKRDVAPDEDAVQRLRYEANLLARLDHRAILNVVDMVNLAGRVSLVTQYLDGDDLLRCVQGQDSIPERALIELCGEVASALHATATNLELVHRDIKPSNIRVTLDGTVKLLDFGIARSPRVERDGHTGTGTVVGTPGYIAPERFLDDAVSPACDVYSLGCVVFAGLTQQRLHQDLSRKRLLQLALDGEEHDREVANRLREVHNPGVRSLLTAMLLHRPEARPAARRVEELCEDLGPRCEGKSLRRWARERRWPEPASEEGDLVGRVIEEEPLVLTASAAASRPAVPPAFGLPANLGAANTVLERDLPTRALSPVPPPQLGSPTRAPRPPHAVPNEDLWHRPPPTAPAVPPWVQGTAQPQAVRSPVSPVEDLSPPTPPVEPPRASPARAPEPSPQAPRPTPPRSAEPARPAANTRRAPAASGGGFAAPVIILALGGLMYGFLAMEGHAPPPRDLWLLVQAAANDAQLAWRHRDR